MASEEGAFRSGEAEAEEEADWGGEEVQYSQCWIIFLFVLDLISSFVPFFYSRLFSQMG